MRDLNKGRTTERLEERKSSRQDSNPQPLCELYRCATTALHSVTKLLTFEPGFLIVEKNGKWIMWDAAIFQFGNQNKLGCFRYLKGVQYLQSALAFWSRPILKSPNFPPLRFFSNYGLKNLTNPHFKTSVTKPSVLDTLRYLKQTNIPLDDSNTFDVWTLTELNNTRRLSEPKTFRFPAKKINLKSEKFDQKWLLVQSRQRPGKKGLRSKVRSVI